MSGSAGGAPVGPGGVPVDGPSAAPVDRPGAAPVDGGVPDAVPADVPGAASVDTPDDAMEFSPLEAHVRGRVSSYRRAAGVVCVDARRVTVTGCAAGGSGVDFARPPGVWELESMVLDPDEVDARRSPHGLVSVAARFLEDQPGGPVLAHVLDALEPAGVGEQELVEAIAGFERLASWAMSAQARFVAELTDRRGSGSNALTEAGAEIGARLGTTTKAGEAKVHFASGLCLFPRVADALTTGTIDTKKAGILSSREPGMSIEDHRRAVDELLDEAGELSGTALKARLRKAALTIDPDAGAKRRVKEHADRRVVFDPAPDAMAWISAYVRADDAARVRTILDAVAKAAKGGKDTDPRSLDQVRADAFVDVFTTLADRGVDLTGQPLPTRTGTAGGGVSVQVTVGAGTLLGVDDEPGMLGGYGPIPADLARQIAQDGTWRALFTDADGQFRALGTKKYRPGADLTRTIVARDVTCTFPGCRQPAVCCDLDHIVAYDPACAARIAQTTEVNLHPLCRRHHNLKTNKKWGARRTADGSIVWTAPTGHTYRRRPEPIPGTPTSRSAGGGGPGGGGAGGRGSGGAGSRRNGAGGTSGTGGGNSGGASPPDPQQSADDTPPF